MVAELPIEAGTYLRSEKGKVRTQVPKYRLEQRSFMSGRFFGASDSSLEVSNSSFGKFSH